MSVSAWPKLSSWRSRETRRLSVCHTRQAESVPIGVYSQDKRFMGYIIKEEGKPLTSYVLRCNSAALMVSLMSFLRQSCQLTSFQRGGSFYDELSADDVDDCDYIFDVSGVFFVFYEGGFYSSFLVA